MQMSPIAMKCDKARQQQGAGILPFPTPEDETVKLEWLESSEKFE